MAVERIIYAFSGKRGVGKTAASLYMKNYGFHRVSIAESLRSLAKQIFPFNDLDLSDIKRKEAPYRRYEWSPREFLVNLGEFLRYHDSDYLVKRAVTSFKPGGRFVIDDVRFLNEVNILKTLGAKIIRIERYERDNPYGKNLDIPSETQLDDYAGFDYKIEAVQNLTLNSLTNVIDSIMKERGIARA